MFEVFMIVFACVITVNGPDCYQINEHRFTTLVECETNVVPEVRRLYATSRQDTEAQFSGMCIEMLRDV